jgi:hypothetical protein
MEPLFGPVGSLLINGDVCFQLGNPIFGGAQLMGELLRHAQRVSPVLLPGSLLNQLQYGLRCLVDRHRGARKSRWKTNRRI